MRVILPLLLSLFLTGCGYLFKPSSSYLRSMEDKGYNSIHMESCGPTAISAVLLHDGKITGSEDVSKDILAHSTVGERFARDMLGFIDWKGFGITWEHEFKSAAQRAGYIVTYVSGEHQDLFQLVDLLLRHNERAVVLVEKGQSVNFHYQFTPQLTDIYLAFGHSTKIRGVFILEPTFKPMPLPSKETPCDFNRAGVCLHPEYYRRRDMKGRFYGPSKRALGNE